MINTVRNLDQFDRGFRVSIKSGTHSSVSLASCVIGGAKYSENVADGQICTSSAVTPAREN
jgi:hypothetical protein